MRTRSWWPILSLALCCCFSARAQAVRVVKLPVVQALLTRSTDSVTVVNFWATWCKPCVEELPDFEAERAARAATDQKVRMVLVSLDFVSQLSKKVEPFVAKQEFGAEVWLMAETDANRFIPALEPKWSGAIPFTLVLSPANRRRVFEQPLTRAELAAAIDEALKP